MEKLQAVVTTGIYCRASCSARPAPRNIRSVSSPVAAEASGYRSCLKCRSDKVDMAVDTASPEVNRAMGLISDGYLDHNDEAALAQAVGYSGRQLRRLFDEHIGASPDFVARSRRAHFARRLLDETTLTVTEIGFASGFNSLRQMNRVVKEVFAFTPSELRARRRRNQASASDGGLTLTIEASRSTPEIMDYLSSRAIGGVESVTGGVYRRSFISCGHPGMMEIRPANGSLQITAHLPTFRSLVDDVAGVKRLFGLPAPHGAARRLRRDPLLGPLVKKRPDLAMPGAFDRFETSIRIILGQHISVAGATTISGRLAARLGTPIDAGHGITHTFPDPEALAAGDLTELGITTTRENTIRSFAAAVAAGTISMNGGLSLEALTASLEEMPGIGPWTSHLIAARVFGHADAFPASDLGLRKAGARLAGADQPLKTKEMLEMAEAWRPYRTTAAAHLWFSGGQ